MNFVHHKLIYDPSPLKKREELKVNIRNFLKHLRQQQKKILMFIAQG